MVGRYSRTVGRWWSRMTRKLENIILDHSFIQYFNTNITIIINTPPQKNKSQTWNNRKTERERKKWNWIFFLHFHKPNIDSDHSVSKFFFFLIHTMLIVHTINNGYILKNCYSIQWKFIHWIIKQWQIWIIFEWFFFYFLFCFKRKHLKSQQQQLRLLLLLDCTIFI